MAKTDQLGVRLPPDIKAAIAQAAANERRTMSSLIEKVMADWLVANGYLKSGKAGK